jgi:hypothetical protein
MPTDKTIYGWRINSAYTPPAGFNISNVFDMSTQDDNASPIDMFIQKSVELNRLLLDPNSVKGALLKLKRGRRLKQSIYDKIITHIDNPVNVSPVLSNLVVLGHISAVESYFREMFRQVILIDNIAQDACREQFVTFGAATTHDVKTLPNALLEKTTFSGRYNIQEALKDYLDFKGNLPTAIDEVLKEFSKICQLRHCIVHRFGKLGVSNAIKIDWQTHKSHVERPIKINYNDLQNVSQICSNLVKEINNYSWQTLMMRLISDGTYNSYKKKNTISWTWNWKDDKAKFKKYYDIFFSVLASPTNVDIKSAYRDYQNKYLALP